MAITFGASLGTPAMSGASLGTTLDYPITATVPAGGTLIAIVCWFGAAATVTVSGGLTWVRDVTFNNGSDRISIMRASAPAGMTPATLTFTWSISVDGREIGGVYYNGMHETSPFRTNNIAAPAAGAAWNGGSVTTVAGSDVVIGGALGDGSTSTASTPAANLDERHDWVDGPSFETVTLVDRGLTSAIPPGSYTVSGTWTGTGAASQVNVGVSTVYIAASVPDIVEPRDSFEPARFGPFG